MHRHSIPFHQNPTPLQRFDMWLCSLLVAVAARQSPRLWCGTVVGAVPPPLLGAIYRRLSRLRNRILALMAKIDAGFLTSRARASRAGRSSERVRRECPAGETMPRTFAWLVALGYYEVAGCGAGLEKMLGLPEMNRYLAVPQMARMLRPLCHMLAIKPPVLAAATARAQAAIPATPAAVAVPVAPHREPRMTADEHEIAGGPPIVAPGGTDVFPRDP